MERQRCRYRGFNMEFRVKPEAQHWVADVVVFDAPVMCPRCWQAFTFPIEHSLADVFARLEREMRQVIDQLQPIL
ncbi:hypothetical protein PMO31116_04166 [Pandoraea morbifera]|uniref:Uncharacterized protein n=1 Tax=Pandoraea morbifera TaxID=2508300 RepID=A0A5E4Y118_9BURK|nr:hypothetical protein PMO31116_04166 [Pandoraea morbifera]